jgi:hypothetical protein
MLNRKSWLIPALLVALALLLAVPQVLARQDDDTVELVGLIETVRVDEIEVNGLLIYTAGAEINVPLEVDQPVKVEGALLTDGAIQAREIDAAERGLLPGEIEIVGTLASLDAFQAEVNGLVFDVRTAEVQSGLELGERVKVHASLSPEGTWIAREIERYIPGEDDMMDDQRDDGDDLDDKGEFEIVGTLDEIGDGFIQVSGQVIDTASAEIEGQLVIGALVKVEGYVIDGAWIAREVEPTGLNVSAFDDDDMDDEDDDFDDDMDDDSDGDAVGACRFEVEYSSVNLRSGPGTGYGVVGLGYDDEVYPVTGLHEGSTWAQVMGPDDVLGWVSLSVGELDGNCDGMPVLTTPFQGEDVSPRDDDDSFDDDADDDFDDDFDDDMDDDSSDDSDDDSDDDSSDDDDGPDDDESRDNEEDDESDDD